MKQVFLSCALSLLLLAAQAQTWVPFTQNQQQSPIVEVLQSNNQQVQLSIEFTGMYSSDIANDGTVYQRLSIPGCINSEATGSPELPYLSKYIAIPECEGVSLSFSSNTPSILGNYAVYPSPDHELVEYPDGTSGIEEVFSKSVVDYSKNQFVYGVDAEIVSQGYLRGQKYACINIYPLQYNAATQQLQIKSDFTLTLQFTNPSTDVNANTGIFNSVASSMMPNYVSTGMDAKINDHVAQAGTVEWLTLTDPAQANAINADYLIICSEPFFEPNNPDSEVLRIANHRAEYNGFNVTILKANNVFAEVDFEYDDPMFIKEQKLRSCIKRIYEGANAQHTYDGKLGYVLLIGDVDVGNTGMPLSYDYYSGFVNQYWPDGRWMGDYYFSCLTKDATTNEYDDIGDLFIGRFCVDNNSTTGQTELHNIVEKTIKHETEFNPGYKNAFDGMNGSWVNETYYNQLFNTYIEPELLNGESYTRINYFDYEDNANWEQMKTDFINMANDGAGLMFYNGHGSYHGWQTNINAPFIKENLNNANKMPFALSMACLTGRLDYDATHHCMGEELTTYSPNKGFVGFIGSTRANYLNVPYSYPQLPEQPTSFQSRFPYFFYYKLNHISGEMMLASKLANFGAMNECSKYLMILFGDPALNIMAEGYKITHDITLEGEVSISNTVEITNNSTLIISDFSSITFKGNGGFIVGSGSNLIAGYKTEFAATEGSHTIEVYGNMQIMGRLSNEATIIVKNGGSLSIGSDQTDLSNQGNIVVEEGGQLSIASNASIGSSTIGSSLIISGALQLGSGVAFSSSSTSTDHSAIALNNRQNTYTINNATFTNCGISGTCSQANILGSTFNNGFASLENGNYDISNCTFNQSYIELDNVNKTAWAYVDGCTVQNCTNNNAKAAVYMDGFPDYRVNNNSIQNNTMDGLFVSNCGLEYSKQAISGNTIAGNTEQENNVAGIRLYNSFAKLSGNSVTNNKNGILSLNNSHMELRGNSAAIVASETQQIMNNDGNEVYATSNSFPYYFRYNAIVDEDNTVSLVYFNTQDDESVDVRYNYWGSNLAIDKDFFPYTQFAYLPIWTPGSGSASESTAATLYQDAAQDVEQGRYAQAASTSKNLVAQYPETQHAKAGLQLLMAIETLQNGNFRQLKNYYSKPSLQSNLHLRKLASRLANQCNIKMQDYQEAITWFESVIQNPETLEDEIFAIIDLEHTYLLMQNSQGKSAGYVGKLAQYKPESKEAFVEHRRELMNLLIGEGNGFEAKSKDGAKVKKLIINKPNPFTNNTTLEYEVTHQAFVSVNVYSISGQKVMTLVNANKEKGVYKTKISAPQLPEGIYTYTLELDGKIIERNKMVVLK